MGLKVFTNLHYRKPEVCSTEKIMPYTGPLYLKSGGYSPMYSAPLKIACGYPRIVWGEMVKRIHGIGCISYYYPKLGILHVQYVMCLSTTIHPAAE